MNIGNYNKRISAQVASAYTHYNMRVDDAQLNARRFVGVDRSLVYYNEIGLDKFYKNASDNKYYAYNRICRRSDAINSAHGVVVLTGNHQVFTTGYIAQDSDGRAYFVYDTAYNTYTAYIDDIENFINNN